MRSLKTGIAVVLAAALVWLLLALPVDVPDTNSPPHANHSGSVNGASTIGQTFVPSRNGLHRVEVALAVEDPSVDTGVTFQVSQVPWIDTRTVVRRLSELPEGKAADHRPGTITERWYSFGFDPIADSAGKNMYFSLEGKGIQGPNSVDLLMFFHNSYPLGEAYVNGEAANAHVVFKTYSTGNALDLAQVVLENLTYHLPSPLGHPSVVVGTMMFFVVLATTTVRFCLRAG